MQAPESPWQMRPTSKEVDANAPGRRQTDEEGADDAEDESPLHDLYPSNSIGESAKDDDKDAREQRRDGHGNVHHAHLNSQIRCHR